ncbi:hypothetical protein BDV93DRAFT_44090 [Ceratobasidium sp. AG-I]|nr:hypothetical protein BDV93DRAFT_44090 [Ceratobasidium sp. AG-I]
MHSWHALPIHPFPTKILAPSSYTAQCALTRVPVRADASLNRDLVASKSLTPAFEYLAAPMRRTSCVCLCELDGGPLPRHSIVRSYNASSEPLLFPTLHSWTCPILSHVFSLLQCIQNQRRHPKPGFDRWNPAMQRFVGRVLPVDSRHSLIPQVNRTSRYFKICVFGQPIRNLARSLGLQLDFETTAFPRAPPKVQVPGIRLHVGEDN